MTPRPVSGAVADADSRAVAGTVSRAVTIAVVAAAALFPAPAWSAGSLQRFALVVGANAGGADRPQLQYAISDAERFGRVLVELGGVAPAHAIVLRQPKLRDLADAFDLLTRQVNEARRARSTRSRRGCAAASGRTIAAFRPCGAA